MFNPEFSGTGTFPKTEKVKDSNSELLIKGLFVKKKKKHHIHMNKTKNKMIGLMFSIELMPGSINKNNTYIYL